jgi:polar amino acid transport system substrate-binding protein
VPTITPNTLTLVCSSLDVPPLFTTDDATGRRGGYEPDASAAVAAAAGLELEWIFRPWGDFAGALERVECDAIWCGCAITPQRQEIFDFSAPYAVFNESVVTRPGAGVASGEDLAEMRVLAIEGSTNLALAETFPGAIPVPFDASTSDDVLGEMLALLRAGEVDAVVDDDVCFIEPDPTIELAFTARTANAWGAACRKGDAELVALLDDAIARADLAGVWQRWLGALAYPL